MARELPFRIVDAFTERPFEGNRAGVVLDADGLDDGASLAIAREVNASETAFVSRGEGGEFGVRFFTPQVEVPLCGHATLAAFLALAEEGRIDAGRGKARATMRCRAGALPISVDREGDRWRVRQTQAKPAFRAVAESAARVAELHGLDAGDLLADLPVRVVSTGLPLLLVPVLDAARLARAKADARLAAFQQGLGAAGSLLYTLDAPTGFRAEMRLFGDAVGIVEDPATGTGAGALGASLVEQRIVAARDGVATARFLQGVHVARRSELTAEVSARDGAIEEVAVIGTGVVTVRGTIAAP